MRLVVRPLPRKSCFRNPWVVSSEFEPCSGWPESLLSAGIPRRFRWNWLSNLPDRATRQNESRKAEEGVRRRDGRARRPEAMSPASGAPRAKGRLGVRNVDDWGRQIILGAGSTGRLHSAFPSNATASGKNSCWRSLHREIHQAIAGELGT